MAGQAQTPDEAELTELREKVSRLERRVTELTRAEQSLAESRAFFDSFMGLLPVPAWMKDESGRYRYANRAFLDLLGPVHDSVLGISDYDIWPAEVAQRIRKSDQEAIAARQARHSTEWYPFPDGAKHFRVVRFPFSHRPAKRYCGAIAIEITERMRLEDDLKQARAAEEAARTQAVTLLANLRDAEARGRRLFESPVTGIMLCAGDLILDANDTLLGWLELSRADINESPKNWRKLTAPRCAANDDRALAELRSSGSFAPYEKEFVSQSGRRVPVITGGTALDSPSGEYLCFAINISERKQMEERLLRSQRLESLGLISSGVAHDINNLLGTIMGNCSLAADAISREHPGFRHLWEVQIASRRASDLTQQMLAYAGRASFSIHPIDISTAIREIGSLLETTISKKINLKFELAPGLPYIDSAEGYIQQIIMNLIINASEAIGENPGEIQVSTRVLDSFEDPHGAPRRGNYVALEVRDTGCGMSEETKAHIFDPFFTTKTDGRGIGLATVLGIVRNHKGALLVDSQLGQGTTFRVVFPASESQPATRFRSIAPARQDLWGTETILVADDDEGIRRMNRAALERFGYKVLLAADGEEAVKIFRQHHQEIAVVLLDWAMPVMNGDEALLRILEIDPNAKVLMSSGYAETGTLNRGERPLIAGFVQKPYTTTQMIEHMRQVIASGAVQKPAAAGVSSAGMDFRSSDS